ncbi:tetratricopeptide repeat protein [Thermodesulfobacteriota bacterium]
MLAWGIPKIFGKGNLKKDIIRSSSFIVFILLMICTSLQVSHWRNSITLFKHTLDVTSNNYVIHNNYGRAILFQDGKEDEAMSHFKKALEINPESEYAHTNIGILLAGEGKLEEAVSQFSRALSIQPYDEQAHFNLGLALSQQGKIDEAIKHYKEALQINPANEKVHNNLAVALTYGGYMPEAIKHFREALKINPNYIEAKNNLNEVLIFLKEENN